MREERAAQMVDSIVAGRCRQDALGSYISPGARRHKKNGREVERG